jgi:hypothetical protein
MSAIRDPRRDSDANINVCERTNRVWAGHPVTL